MPLLIRGQIHLSLDGTQETKGNLSISLSKAGGSAWPSINGMGKAG
jgi:hypothetical protein